jgi:arylsulfatase A-like enzyme
MELDARISSYELAARLQLSASDALDVMKEDDATRALYGVGEEPTDSYGRRCLTARRLVERGVRFVQLYINSQIWDTHTNLEDGMRAASARTDKPVAALLQDLDRRGLLKDTLVVWGGEFGRMPIAQLGGNPRESGRDHNPRGFSLWMAGGGVKPGITYGATDDLGYEAVENKVSVTDWHATILHLLGLDYEKLVFDQNGLKEKLTSVFEARVVKEILA